MSEANVYYCSSCGGALNVNINRAFVFCQYCGAKNVIDSQQMKSDVKIGSIKITANIETDNIVNAAEYAISMGDTKKANELLMSAIMSGNADYRVYVCKTQIDFINEDDKSLFASLKKLEEMEKATNDPNITNAIRELMAYRGVNGVIALHCAAFQERFDLVKFCVEHGADVNCRAGMNNVTPISIMYVPVDSTTTCKLDGTPFVRNWAVVKQIRDYLVEHGGIDTKYKAPKTNTTRSKSGKVVNKVLYCILAFLFGGIGAHKIYAGRIGAGLVYFLFCWSGVPALIAFVEFIICLTKESDANGNIVV